MCPSVPAVILHVTIPYLTISRPQPRHRRLTKTGFCASSDIACHYSISHHQPATTSPPPPHKNASSVATTSQDIYRTSPRKHLASVENIRYWFDKNPTLTDMPKVQIDTDIRQLFAIGKLDDFEKMRKENDLSLSTLRGMEARVKERIRRLRMMSTSELIKSVEYSTLKELAMSVENLGICLDEENRLLAAFWMSELPPINARGEFYDSKLAAENDSLKGELVRLKSKYDFANRMIQSTEERLHATNKRRENMEHAVFKQLNKTAKVLSRANANMLRNVEDAGTDTKR
ncbi:uncharacterized protein LOC121382823 [Gigantopelta aegis]|uniref:uncharacterized protein LOC121382823 n=1 Tax=Gigantopelta aegis TaxID=1735272 RepID=UPI001B88D7E0|nr:uncharacterized protein LOC121382823 [Gigantopelta aegis]